MKKCAIKKNSHKIVDYEMKIQHRNHDKIHDMKQATMNGNIIAAFFNCLEEWRKVVFQI